MELFSVTFIAFLLAVLGVYYLLPRAVRPAWLLVCSYAFYLYDLANWGFVLLLASASLITWLVGLLLEKAQALWQRRALLAVALAACLLPLGYYKYAGFFARAAASVLNLFGGSYAAPQFRLVLPLGISYFTFAALGYVFDQYARKYPAEKNPLYYALFVSFFPCIVTGPIERADRMLPQLRQPMRFDYDTFTGGVFRILYGFFKKLVLAGILAERFTSVWQTPQDYPGPTVALAALLFTAYLYFDFSSCSDIAIGAGACLGITVSENFRRPLASPTFKMLWDNWHMSLTGWLEDYIFTPVAWSGWEHHVPGLKKRYADGGHPTVIALFVTYLVSGFWHGASWNYILWGLLNGVFLYIGNVTRKKRKKLNKKNPFFTVRALAPLRRCCQTGFTYLLFSFTLVLFWVDLYAQGGLTASLAVYARIFTDGWGQLAAILPSQMVLLGVTAEAVLVLLAGVLLTNFLEMPQTPVNVTIRKVPIYLRWPLYYLLIAAILFYGAFGQSAFIYQQY